MKPADLTERERSYICAALNFLHVSAADGDWSAFTVYENLEADGIRPLTGPMTDRLIRRLERAH